MTTSDEKRLIIEKYWLNRLSGEIPKIGLPRRFDVEKAEEVEMDSLRVPVPGVVYTRLAGIANNSDIALFILFLSGLKVMLHRYTGIEDLLVGTVPPKDEKIKTKLLFCRSRLPGELTLKEVVNRVKETVLEAFDYSDYSFGVVFQKLMTDSNSDTLDIFNAAFIYEGFQKRKNSLKQFDLVFILSGGPLEPVLEVEYNKNLYSARTVERFCRNVLHLFERFHEIVDLPVAEIDILCPGEKEELAGFQGTAVTGGTAFPKNETIHQLFEEQVERTPAGTAVVFDDIHLTYSALNEESNRLARLLREKGVKANTVVGLMVNRSPRMVIVQLGILKAGGAYLPIDPDTPSNRVVSMLEDSSASLLLTEEKIIESHQFTRLQGLEFGSLHPLLTAPRTRVTDFDRLPFPDRSLIDSEKYNQYIGQALVKNRIVIQASRGCPHSCAYCYRIWPRKQVARSGKNIFEEIMLYYNLGIRKFDIFMMNIKSGGELFRLIIDNTPGDIELYFPNGFRGDLLTKDYIDLMVKAGTVNFALALETASPRLQKLIDKKLDIEKFREIAEYTCEKYPHVILELFTMHGIPTETEEEARMTLDFVKSLKWVHFPYVNVLKIYHNTGMERLALENGISRESILRSEDMAWHEWSETLPFDKSFTSQYQSEFLTQYLLSRERLLHVLPHQVKRLSEDEFLQKYNSFFPVPIETFSDFLNFTGLREEDVTGLRFRDAKEDTDVLRDLNKKIAGLFPPRQSSKDALRVLLLDVSQFFTGGGDMLYDVVDPPLGLMYILTYLNQKWPGKVLGKILKPRLDFDSYDELRTIVKAFKPQVIGIRSLSYYKDFFHRTVSIIRQWGIDVPIIAGGPYATVDYEAVLQDRNIDLAVLSEGEETFSEIIGKIIENKGKLPDEEELEKIEGIAFFPRSESAVRRFAREIVLPERFPERLSRGSAENLPSLSTPYDLAYVIFTSGSTGKPKGVLTEHANIVNVLKWFGASYRLQPHTHVIQLTNYTFDPSVEQVFGTLLQGGAVYLAPKDLIADGAAFHRFMDRNRINIINFVPGTLKELLVNGKRLESLDAVISGGEKLDDTVKNRVLEKGYSLFNQYGPTETTVDALMGECRAGGVTLGKPIANVSCCILDNNRKQVPIEIPGELYIGGAGVGRGYLNQPGQTDDRFLPDCFVEGARMYRTGDLVRWLTDGSIEFLGRMDHQVKIRGYRIELGEIEAHLRRHKKVSDAVVTAFQPDGSIFDGDEKYLCAYIVPPSPHGFDVLELRDFLAENLPNYMVPSYFTWIDAVPLTSNGKVDRAALPVPEQGETGDELVPPSGEVEKTLVGIWSELLGMEEEKIGANSNFFEMGGYSLKATILLSRIHKEFSVKVALGEIFKTPTVRGLAECIEGMGFERKNRYVSIEPAPVKDYYVLSSAQKRLYVLQQMEIDSTVYNMPQVIYPEGEPERERLEEIFRKLVDRHESLRTSFLVRDGEPVQKIHRDMEFEIESYETGAGAAGKKTEEVINEFVKPFSLENPPLFRIALVKTGTGTYLLLVDMHHIIADGISHEVLEKDFVILSNHGELPPLRLQYKDYAGWQNSRKTTAEIKKQEMYWLKEFEGEIPTINLPTDYVRPAIQSFEGDIVTSFIEDAAVDRLNNIVSEEGATLYMGLLSLFYIFLSKVSGQEEIVVGIEAAGRNHADLEKIIGMFINTLPLKNHTGGKSDTKTSREFLREVKENVISAFENQDYPFEDMVEKFPLKRDLSRNPIFDILFAFQKVETAAAEKQKPGETALGKQKEHYNLKHRTSRFDLTFAFFQMEEHVVFSVEYCTKLFKEQTIKRFVSYFKQVMSNVMEDVDKEITGIRLITEEQMRQVLFEFNDTKKDIVRDRCCHQLFEEQAKRTPDSIAAVYGEGHLTYSGLDRMTNRLARLLRSRGISRDRLVAVLSHRCIETLIGILGIFKAGGGYIPLDVGAPPDRITRILSDSEPTVILTAPDSYPMVEDYDPWVVDPRVLSEYSPQPLQSVSEPRDLAYVIYTSGSTGNPKGVMIHHQGMLNHLHAEINNLSIVKDEVIAQTASVTFDISVWQFLAALIVGGSIVIIDTETVLQPRNFLEVLERKKITILQSVPSLMRVFLEALEQEDRKALKRLRWMVLIGEALIPSLVRKWYTLYPHIPLVNAYGPTEASDAVAHYFVSRKLPENRNTISIGKPLQNLHIYILDKNLSLCPTGIRGEICVAGLGVGKGYLGDPQKTTESFIPNPFIDEIGDEDFAVLYKTGDIGYFREDGHLECLGRLDYQVKVRGFRIELEEIESLLLEDTRIKEAVVTANPGFPRPTDAPSDGDRYLCGYIVPESSFVGEGREIDVAEIRESLARRLPDYMIPPYFVQLEQIPVTPSGKVDRKALPLPEIGSGDIYEKPKDKIQEELRGICSNILGIPVESLGIGSNFFDLGLHSLNAIVLGSRVHKAFDVQIPLTEIFKTPTVKGLSRYIGESTKNKYTAVEPVEEKEYYALSPAQKRLYVVQQMFTDITAYNIPLAVVAEGELEPAVLETVFRELIERHESFRTSFEIVKNEPVERIHRDVDFEIEYRDLTDEKESADKKQREKEIIRNFERPFDLAAPPLLRVGLIRVEEKKHILLVDMHHIISDGVSHNILVKDFTALAAKEGEELPPLKLQYKDYSEWQNSYERKENMKKQEEYWLKRFEGEIPRLNIPIDYPRPLVRRFDGSVFYFEIGSSLTEQIRHLAAETESTIFIVMLAAFNVLLGKYTKQQDIIIGTPIVGRRHEDLENIIGFFVNMLAMRNRQEGEMIFGEFLEVVKENAYEAYENQDIQFEELVSKLDIERYADRNALFDVVFELQTLDSRENEEDNSEDRGHLEFYFYKYEYKTSKFDLLLGAVEGEKEISMHIEYSAELFKPAAVKKIAERYTDVLEQVVQNPDLKLKEVRLSYDLFAVKSVVYDDQQEDFDF